MFVFQPPSEPRLVARLKTVCQREGLPVAAPSLSALCAAAGMDIRAGAGVWLAWKCVHWVDGPSHHQPPSTGQVRVLPRLDTPRSPRISYFRPCLSVDTRSALTTTRNPSWAAPSLSPLRPDNNTHPLLGRSITLAPPQMLNMHQQKELQPTCSYSSLRHSHQKIYE